MSFSARRAAFVAALAFVAAPAMAQQGGAGPAAPQPAHCGGLFCDMYYASRPPAQPGVPEPAPGQPGSIFLPCHDFVCGMFGGRTPDQPVAAATEPMPVASEPPAKPKKKHAAKHGVERTARNDKAGDDTARNEMKPADDAKPAGAAAR